ncbi:rCG49582, isoform CRA_b [Rattus norvegicus]|uniref:RCG49582, isoform CRA_b n=1 Tax=Rattus norvegicus TaxID=10116 RepID=A6J2S5_RAT|nr:rCG49582, isoform CRA_b [Rattus norvegicus]
MTTEHQVWDFLLSWNAESLVFFSCTAAAVTIWS